MLTSALTSFVATLLLVTNAVSANPVGLEKRASCNKKDFQAFRLYAAPADGSSDDWSLVKLIDLYTPRPTNDTFQALSVRQSFP